MKVATISEIKRELKTLPPERVIELCLELARFKKDNKELLNYKLYESGHEEGYIETIKEEIEEDFELLNTTSFYLAKKTIRKVLRKLNKYIRYSSLPETAIVLNIHFLDTLRTSSLDFKKSKVLVNIYHRRLDLIDKALKKLHPDLQFDYEEELERLRV